VSSAPRRSPPPGPPPGPRTEWLLGLATFALAAWSAPQGLHWLDSGEFVAAARLLAVAHPPGQPLHSLLAHAAQLLPVGPAALRASWASAAALGLAWAFALRSLRRLAGPLLPEQPGLTAWGGLALGLAAAWAAPSLLQGVRAEVYALHAALVLAALDQLLQQTAPARLRAALLLGFGLANHHYLVFLALPAMALLAWPAPRAEAKSPSWRRIGLGSWLPLNLAAGALGLLTYAYLPLRAASRAPFAWGDPRSPERFWWVLTAKVFQKSLRAQPGATLQNLAEAGLMLMEPLHPVGFVAAGVGLFLLGRRQPRVALALAALALGTLLSQSLMSPDPHNPDLQGYFLPALAVIYLGAGYCGVWLWAAARGSLAPAARAGFAAVLALPLVLLPLRSLQGAQEPLRLRGLRSPDMLAHTLLDRLPPHALALTSDFSTVFLLWGERACELARPDLELVHRPFLPFPGWVARRTRSAPELRPLLQHLSVTGSGLWDAPPPPRPTWVEPYHDLDPASARELWPDGLLHHWRPAAQPAPDRPQAEFWSQLYATLPAGDLDDPQTRRYLFWQHSLQGLQQRRRGAPRSARDEWERALALAPGSPEILQFLADLDQAPAQAPAAHPSDLRFP